MFEHDQSIVDRLLAESDEFTRLFNKHHQLKERVHDANAGTAVIDEAELENMKKQKLLLKDRMAAMIEEFRRTGA